MDVDYILKDTKQIKKLKEYSLFHRYSCSGEVYKLLSLKIGHDLAKKIKKGRICLNSTLMYGKNYLTLEENFVALLDKYVGYIRRTYTIDHNELVIIIEQTLKNMYTQCLFVETDYHESIPMFIKSFKKMFLANLVYNTRYYAKKDINKEYYAIQKVNMFLDGKKWINYKDVDDVEKLYINIINNRKNNLYNAFIPHAEIDKKRLDFYMHQLNWIYDDYLKKYTETI